jgi:hypothetical protein
MYTEKNIYINWILKRYYHFCEQKTACDNQYLSQITQMYTEKNTYINWILKRYCHFCEQKTACDNQYLS